MGDVVHTLPAVTDLLKAYPNAVIDWVVETSFADIPKVHPGVNKVINISIRKWRKQLFNANTIKEIQLFLADLREANYDYIIDAQGLFKSAILTRLARSKRASIHGYDKTSARGKFIAWMYNKQYVISKNQHAILRLKQLFAQVFAYQYDPVVNYGIGSKSNTSATEKPYLLFFHGTTWESKMWPTSSWQELVIIANQHGYQVRLTAGNLAELNRAKKIAQDMDKNNAIVMPPESIKYLIQEIAHSTGVICVDTGLGHLAAALNKPGIGIFGATNPQYTAILANNFINLQSAYKCSPCLLKKCNQPQNAKLKYPPCYDELSPTVVWNKFLDLLHTTTH